MPEAIITCITWFMVGVVPVLIMVVIQNMIGRLVIPLALGGPIARKGFLATALIGVPIHELSHAIVAIVFRHRILHICFFDFTPEHGRIGYVSHQWNRLSLYQSMGLFFIGIAPLIGAGLVIWGATAVLLPDMLDIFAETLLAGIPYYSGNALSDSTTAVWTGIENAIQALRAVQHEPKLDQREHLSRNLRFRTQPTSHNRKFLLSYSGPS